MSRSASMLIVDDNEVELMLMSLTLQEAFPGVVLSEADGPTTARAMCGAHAFDCVLLDYSMPEMDGLMFAQELRESFRYLPIVLFTSVGDEMLAARALHGGVSDYIPKARVNVESIRRVVERTMKVADQARVIDEQRAELENFAYALAHDFKQPIRQIRTFTSLIADGVERGDSEKLHQHLAFLNEAARRLGDLVDVMSQYTLLSQTPEIGDVDFNKTVASVRSSLSPYLEERGAQFIASEGPIIRGNETLLTQVLQNLVVNGLKYNESPVPCVALSAETQGARCIIKVEDNGIGIAPQYLTEIFKPLVRLHTSAEYSGTGLGLTLTRKAVAAQGGRIWCESAPGKGSIFYVQLPYRPPDGAPQANAGAGAWLRRAIRPRAGGDRAAARRA